MNYDDIDTYLWTTEINNDFFTIDNRENGKIFLVGETTNEEEKLFKQNGFIQTKLSNVWFR